MQLLGAVSRRCFFVFKKDCPVVMSIACAGACYLVAVRYVAELVHASSVLAKCCYTKRHSVMLLGMVAAGGRHHYEDEGAPQQPPTPAT
jgi:hypothetical protein